MPRTVAPPFPNSRRQLVALGERLRLARKRRRFSAVLMAERVGISRDTFNRVEKGDPAVSLGTYLKVLRVLGLDADLDLIARDDTLGRKLQDLNLEPKPADAKTRKSRADT
jgi:transcriptional regulator with XRE-family HTH domain